MKKVSYNTRENEPRRESVANLVRGHEQSKGCKEPVLALGPQKRGVGSDHLRLRAVCKPGGASARRRGTGRSSARVSRCSSDAGTHTERSWT